MNDVNTTIALRMFDAINAGDLSHADEFISAEYVNHEAEDDDDERTGLQGPAEFIATNTWLRGAYADLNFRIEEIIAEKDKVVVRTTMTGTHVGEW